MQRNSVEDPQESLQIKQDDKFYSRLMSKESSKVNSSSRVYYGGASGAVPFIWESQPGTPKHPLYNYDDTLPPLTPPPSYQSASISNALHKHSRPNNLLATIFPCLLSKKKNHVSPPLSSSSWSCNKSSSSSSSSFSSCSANSTNSRSHRRNLSGSALRNYFGMDDYHEDQQYHHQGHGSPTSTLWFSGKRRSPSKFRGCY